MSLDVTPLLFDEKNRVTPLDDADDKARRVIGTEILSYAQQRLWFLARLEPETPLYNVPSALRLQGPLKVKALTDSLKVIVERHEILRTNYGIKEGAPVQVIHSAAPFSLEPEDIPTAGDREKHLATLLEREGSRPFDLASEPVIRARLFRLAAEDHVLFLDIHHIACDEWSMAVLFQELAELYGKLSRGELAAKTLLASGEV